MYNHIKQDLHYTLKAIKSIFSGYSRLEQKGYDDEFEPIFTQDSVDPYYACARFNNGRHLPLPLVIGAPSEYRLQSLVLKLLRWHPAMRRAADDCRRYEDGTWEFKGIPMLLSLEELNVVELMRDGKLSIGDVAEVNSIYGRLRDEDKRILHIYWEAEERAELLTEDMLNAN